MHPAVSIDGNRLGKFSLTNGSISICICKQLHSSVSVEDNTSLLPLIQYEQSGLAKAAVIVRGERWKYFDGGRQKVSLPLQIPSSGSYYDPGKIGTVHFTGSE